MDLRQVLASDAHARPAGFDVTVSQTRFDRTSTSWEHRSLATRSSGPRRHERTGSGRDRLSLLFLTEDLSDELPIARRTQHQAARALRAGPESH